MIDGLEEKRLRVRGLLEAYSSALVAYSGGVDSTLLALLAHQTLAGRMAAVIVSSPLLPPRELERALSAAAFLGFPCEVVEADELALPGFRHNPPDRCYRCKRHRLTRLREMAAARGWEAVLEGSHRGDADLHRPGRKASAELGAASPLKEAGLDKAEVRALARHLGLPNWDAPSRPCLATRFPYGMELEHALMRRVDAAEETLEGMGLSQVRVRLETPASARIEVGPDEMHRLEGEDNRERLVTELRGLGFRRIELDLDGYRSGSMDENRPARRCRTLYVAEGYEG